MKIKPLFLAALTLVGCGNSMTPDEKIRMLEGEKRRVHADLHRSQAECQAQAIEFQGNPQIVGICWDGFRAKVNASQKILANFDARIAEIGPSALNLTPFAGKLDEKKPTASEYLGAGK